MNPSRTSPHSPVEFAYLATVSLPIVLLIGLLGFGLVRNRAAAARVNAEIMRLRNDGVPAGNHSLTQFFDERTSKETSAGWRDVFVATRSLDPKFAVSITRLDGFDDLVPPGNDWPAESIVDAYVEQGQPVIDSIEQLVSQPKPVWQPLLFDGNYTGLADLQDSRGTQYLLDREFCGAVHANDRDRALHAIRLMRGLVNAFDWRIGMINQMVLVSHRNHMNRLLRGSLQFGFWNEGQLEQLAVWLGDPYTDDADWRMAIDAERAMGIADLESKSRVNEEVGIAALPLGLSAESKWYFLELMRQQADLTSAGIPQHVLATEQPDQRIENGSAPNRFSIVELPFANVGSWTRFYRGTYVGSAAALCQQEADRRWLLTAIAIRQFQIRFDRWPNDLDELAEVGFARENSMAADTEQFGYRVAKNGSEVLLWTVLPGLLTLPEITVLPDPPTEENTDTKNLDSVLMVLSK